VTARTRPTLETHGTLPELKAEPDEVGETTMCRNPADKTRRCPCATRTICGKVGKLDPWRVHEALRIKVWNWRIRPRLYFGILVVVHMGLTLEFSGAGRELYGAKATDRRPLE